MKRNWLCWIAVLALACGKKDESPSKPEQTETKPEAKPEAEPEAKPEAKPEAEPEAKPETKPAPKPAFSLGGDTPSGALGSFSTEPPPSGAVSSGATCDTAAANVVGVLLAAATDEERQAYEPQRAEITAVFADQCRAEGWPASAIACISGATSATAIEGCVAAANTPTEESGDRGEEYAEGEDPGTELPTEPATISADPGTCAGACQKRESCLHKGDAAECEAACTAAQLQAEHLAAFSAKDCETLAAEDDGPNGHMMLRQIVRTCDHIIGCGIKGTMSGCISVAVKDTREHLAEWEATDCKTLKKTVAIEQPTGTSSSPTYSGNKCSNTRCDSDRTCSNIGCGPCFWGRCNTF